MPGRWVRSVRTVWNRSITFSFCRRSRIMLRAMKTPVRPTPALEKKTRTLVMVAKEVTGKTYLQCTTIGPSCPNCSLVLWTWVMNSMKDSPILGTPCSGQST